MDEVIVYSKPVCPACDATKSYLKANGVDFKEINVMEDTESLMMIKDLGYRQVPVIFHGSKHWSGFDQEKLKEMRGANV